MCASTSFSAQTYGGTAPSGTWHCWQFCRFGWGVQIPARATRPWQLVQFCRIHTPWGMRGGSPGQVREATADSSSRVKVLAGGTLSPPMRPTLGACVMTFVGVWIEKGMGLVIPGFIPGQLHELVEYQPSLTEWRVTAGIWAFGLMVYTIGVKIALSLLAAASPAPVAKEACSAKAPASPSPP